MTLSYKGIYILASYVHLEMNNNKYMPNYGYLWVVRFLRTPVFFFLIFSFFEFFYSEHYKDNKYLEIQKTRHNFSLPSLLS